MGEDDLLAFTRSKGSGPGFEVEPASCYHRIVTPCRGDLVLFGVNPPLTFKALASGSSGNAYLLRTDRTTMLVEAGLRLPLLRKYLANEGLAPGDLSAVLISHEHRDHCISALDLATEYGVPVWANEPVLVATGLAGAPSAAILPVGRPMMLGDVEVTTFPVSHDAVCPVGFFLSAAGRTITVATDLGVPSDDVAEAIRLADLVVLEANHDTEMLHGGKYPYHLRRRIAGETGHLSNMQASTLAGRQVKGADVEVWLAHLSKENNTPELATRTVRGALRASGLDSVRVGVVRRDRPSLRWTGSPSPRQLTLFSPDGLA